MNHILDVIDTYAQLVDVKVETPSNSNVSDNRLPLTNAFSQPNYVASENTNENECETNEEDSDIEVLSSSSSKNMANKHQLLEAAHILNGISENGDCSENLESLVDSVSLSAPSSQTKNIETSNNKNDSSLVISNYDLILDEPASTTRSEQLINHIEQINNEEAELIESESSAHNNNTNNGKPFFTSKLTNSQISEELSHEIGLWTGGE
jgi:hypothetical protein